MSTEPTSVDPQLGSKPSSSQQTVPQGLWMVLGGGLGGILANVLSGINQAGVMLPGSVLALLVSLILGAVLAVFLIVQAHRKGEKKRVVALLFLLGVVSPWLASWIGGMLWFVYNGLFWLYGLFWGSGGWLGSFKEILGGIRVGSSVGALVTVWLRASTGGSTSAGQEKPADSPGSTAIGLAWDDPQTYRWEIQVKGHSRFWNNLNHLANRLLSARDSLSGRPVLAVLVCALLPLVLLVLGLAAIGFLLCALAYFCMVLGGMLYLYCESVAYVLGHRFTFWLFFLAGLLLIIGIPAFLLYNSFRSSKMPWAQQLKQWLDSTRSGDTLLSVKLVLGFILTQLLGWLFFLYSSPGSFLISGFSGNTGSIGQWMWFFGDTLTNVALFNIPHRLGIQMSGIEAVRGDARFAVGCLRLVILFGIVQVGYLMAHSFYRAYIIKQPFFHGTTRELYRHLSGRVSMFTEDDDVTVIRLGKVEEMHAKIELTKTQILKGLRPAALEEK